ncbi:MAG TPA: glycosyltransferase [Tepidisphaeraceae bacterium]|nr:glycosyltransferase [Tepidisphaeraceae bacterium]
MSAIPRDRVNALPQYQGLLRSLHFTPTFVFSDPRVIPWRKLPDRENCTLDIAWPDGRPIRLHIKRYLATRWSAPQAEVESAAYRALSLEKIPSPTLVAWGTISDGRSFTMTEDLAGYLAADKLIEAGTPFQNILEPTADLAAQLHRSGLHHRDLYLCHFFIKLDPMDVKLIDVARVRRLPGVLTRRRWIVKDLAQFWYSTLSLPITDEQRHEWLQRYLQANKLSRPGSLGRSVETKARRIGAHDRSLNQRQPGRNISIPTNAKLKIALVIYHADPARGGAERYTADLAAALAARGQETHLLSADFGPEIAGVNFVPLESTGLTRTRRYEGLLLSLEEKLSAGNYDIVHAMLPVPRCDFYHPHAGIAAMARNQTFNPRRRRFAAVERELLTGGHPPVILCLSNFIKSTFSRHYSLPDDRLVTLFNAVDLKKFTPASERKSNDIVALMIAQDFARKGLSQAVAAVAQISDARLKLKVVGRPDPSAYQRQAEQLGVAHRIIFAGPTSNVRDEYAAADFFLLPTRHDPCSLVVLEALAMGLPVISTVFNGACEIMQNGKHGFVLPNPDDIPALAAAIISVMDDSIRRAMRDACLELRPSLSFEAHVSRLLAIYGKARV